MRLESLGKLSFPARADQNSFRKGIPMKNFDSLLYAYEWFMCGPCKKSASGEHQYGEPRSFETTIERGGNTFRFIGSECTLCRHIAIPDEAKMEVVAQGWAT